MTLFQVSAELNTRHNDFPTRWHPDEQGKGAQILELNARHPRNFNHPQLMLEATLLLMEHEHTPREMDAVVHTGRNASAYLAAAGAVMLAWAGFFSAGWPGFLLVGAAAGLCPALVCHAHYFKEDASLVCGMSAVICMAAAIARRRHWSVMLLLSLLLGAACGLAASGKYSGAVMIAPALLLVLVVTLGRWWIMPLCVILLAAGAVGSWSLINYRAINDWEGFREGFDRESEHSMEGHYGVMLPKPNTFFVRITWQEAMPHVKALAPLAPFVLLLARRRRIPRKSEVALPVEAVDAPPPLRRPKRKRRPPLDAPVLFGWWLMLALIVYAAALSWSTIPFYRYAVPLTVMLYALAALSAAWIVRALSTSWMHHALLTAIALVIFASQGWERSQDYLDQFAHDSRNALREWVNAELPANTMIVADGYTDLWGQWGIPSLRTRANVVRETYAPMVTTSFEQLRRMGCQYVVIASSSYERFIDPDTMGMADHEREFWRYQKFYRTLFEKYPIVKQWKAEHPMWAFTNPDIYVFKIGDGQAQPMRQPQQRRRGS